MQSFRNFGSSAVCRVRTCSVLASHQSVHKPSVPVHGKLNMGSIYTLFVLVPWPTPVPVSPVRAQHSVLPGSRLHGPAIRGSSPSCHPRPCCLSSPPLHAPWNRRRVWKVTVELCMNASLPLFLSPLLHIFQQLKLPFLPIVCTRFFKKFLLHKANTVVEKRLHNFVIFPGCELAIVR